MQKCKYGCVGMFVYLHVHPFPSFKKKRNKQVCLCTYISTSFLLSVGFLFLLYLFASFCLFFFPQKGKPLTIKGAEMKPIEGGDNDDDDDDDVVVVVVVGGGGGHHTP